MPLPWNRIGAISGILFAILFVVGTMLAADQPDSGDPDADWLSYFNDDGRLLRNLIGGYLWVVSALLFIVFLVVLVRHLRQVSRGDDVPAGIVLVSGGVFVTMLLVGAFAVVAVPAGIKFGDTPVPSPDFGRMLPQIGFGALLVGGGFSALLLIATTSWVILRTHMLATWIAVLGFVAAIILIFGALFIPMIALPIWMLVISGALLRRPEVTASP
ncbi:MAG TPA: hypothetical protein VFB90_02830 [Dehalococcoidia bacterium]|nr:hypothetical protein [Dehalococcoidia bacterium]